jgi:hypothetical protein
MEFAVCFTLVSCPAYSSTLKMEAIFSPEMSVDFYRTARFISQKMELLLFVLYLNEHWSQMNAETGRFSLLAWALLPIGRRSLIATVMNLSVAKRPSFPFLAENMFRVKRLKYEKLLRIAQRAVPVRRPRRSNKMDLR